MNENKQNTDTVWVDPDDAPELTDEFFERADEYIGERLIRSGRDSLPSYRGRQNLDNAMCNLKTRVSG
ncbi:MAG: hypothetical protein HQL58_13040 [Magnetococcales bacterium]|nr:hypothetical protein [Magnetococcales bacterium]